MAKEKDPTRTRIENIKNELQSIATCTATTVADLREILANKSSDSLEKENVRVKKVQLHNVQPKGRGKAGVAVVDKQATPLAPRERYILATEVANITLKSLADALKIQLPARSSSKAKLPSDETAQKLPKARTAHTKSSSVSSRPLKERSISQVTNSPKKPAALRRSLSYSSLLTTAPEPGLIATAESARLAFGYLGTPEAIKIAGKDSPELQLENGILALVGKLVAHSLDNLAVKEMRILKKRLDRYLHNNDSGQPKGGPTRNATPSHQSLPTETENLASLLDFGDVDRTSAALPIITNLQTYALRVIARIKRPPIVETAWNYLKLSHPSSPANLIWHAAKSADNHTKAARQLESLAQTILLLCPSISSSEDEDDLQPSPDIALCLQHLAFRVRQRWWSLAKHQGDKEKELLEPFTKCLVAYSRRSTLSPSKKYKLAESLYGDLLEATRDAKLSPKQESRSTTLASKVFSSLAQGAGLSNEALRWLESPSSTTARGSAAKAAARLVRIATLSLEACLKGDSSNPDLGNICRDALEALSGNLEGAAAEMDTLLTEAHALRRSATRLLSIKQLPAALELLCVSAITASIHFTNRYLGTIPPAQVEAKTNARYRDRVETASRLVRSTIDSVLSCCRRSLLAHSSWTGLDNLIQDSLHLLRHFEEQAADETALNSGKGEGSQSYLVRFSNAYWSISMQLRKLEADRTTVVAAMQRSIETLQSRTSTERADGLLPMKLERLGEALEQMGRVKESRDALGRCLSNLLDESVDEEINQRAARFPIQQIFEDPNFCGPLVRVLKSFHRSFMMHGLDESSKQAFFDDETKCTPVRGALLEHQVALYQKTLSRNRQWDPALNSSIQAILKLLVHLYSSAQFPIRRQRVCLIVLEFSQAHPDIFLEVSSELDCRVTSVDAVANTHDQGLERFATHLRAFVNLKHCLQEMTPSMPAIRECFCTWQSLLASARTWQSLADRIDNVDIWLHELQACADFLAAKGEEYESLPVLHLLVKVLELRGDPDSSQLVTTLCTLGLQLLRLGYSGKTGLAFAKAETLISKRSISIEARLQWHLGYAEYLLNIGSTGTCEKILSAAAAIAQGDAEFSGLSRPSTTLSGRLRFNRILADACYVSSLLYSKKGNYKEAARCARQCVVLNRRIWAALESKASSKKPVPAQTTVSDAELPGKATFDPLSSLRNENGAPLVMSVTHDALGGAEFWPHVPSLYRALMQHSFVFIDQGLLHEAIYVAEQAEKVATAVGSPSLALENASRRAEYWTQSGRVEKAQMILEALDHSLCEAHLAKVAYHSAVASLHHSNRNFEEELGAYDSMEELLRTLSAPTFIQSTDSLHYPLDSLVDGMSSMSLGVSGPVDTQVRRSAKGRQPASRLAPKVATKASARANQRPIRKAPLKSVPTVVTKAKQKAPSPPSNEKPSISEECSSLYALHTDVSHRKALASLLQDDIASALKLLDKAEAEQRALGRSVIHSWVRFKALLSQALQDIAGDFAFNTLPESTIAFPAVPLKDRESSEGAAGKRSVIAQPAAKTGRGKKQTKEDFLEGLQSAREYLVEAHNLCATAGNSHTFQQVSAALGHVTVLLSAVSGGIMRGSLHPLYAAYMSEIPKWNAMKLSQESVEVEQEPMSREEYLKWPTSTSDRLPLASVTDFQRSCVDIIPESWTAVSIAMNEQHDELYITRYESGASPFVLRLPMTRHSSRDMDEEEFTFTDGKREFEEIIELSDFSTRSAKDMRSREARLQWWTEREALDTKLHELLLNIENIWLGGFKGVLSQHVRQPALLARFRKSFENVLNRNLPSRRKKAQQKKPALDPRVLDLFIGLGDACNEDVDLDDALLDLLYFVVDILQFNGEHNAYDEVDFDAMTVETLDVLRAYHGASQSTPTAKTHMILILDKNLHMLPWESLPCLEKVSISRLPSLAALRERLLAAIPASVTQNAPAGHYISAEAGGTSILNPSGDLTHTLKTIKPRLDGMKGSWSHIANRAPSEKEFEDSLREKELVLYFGHGSGAQFVRSKSVRRLYPGSQLEGEERLGCATTFLFGCSSVHLSDNGIYEPSGMLASYLTAGAPAVVGMLWDVTDKDCDRFAVRAGELWGLWPEEKDDSTAEPPTTARKKGKGKVAQLVEEVETARSSGNGRRGKKDKASNEMNQTGSAEKERHRGMGLDEAVKEARKSCVLRYLNGAAAVMYGIPVYLE